MTKPIDLNDEFTQDVFNWLDNLRESGITNMFGAGPYIEQAWGLSREDANGFLSAWIKTFEERHPDE